MPKEFQPHPKPIQKYFEQKEIIRKGNDAQFGKNDGKPVQLLPEVEIKPFLARYFPSFKVIGAGGECVVVPHPGEEEETVVAYYLRPDLQNNPLDAKDLFYYQNILNELFPHNFPRFYASSSGACAQTIRERVMAPESETETIYPFSNVKDLLEKYNIPILFDSYEENYLVGENGGEYFLDTVPNRGTDLHDVPNSNFYNLMAELELDETSQHQVMQYLLRLRQLGAVQYLTFMHGSDPDLKQNMQHAFRLMRLKGEQPEYLDPKTNPLFGAIDRAMQIMRIDDNQYSERDIRVSAQNILRLWDETLKYQAEQQTQS